MKEPSIEEKAKRYDEAIEKAKYYYDEGKTLEYANDIVSDIFPELKESEDEKIRKEILEYFQQFENEELRGVNISDWLSWLEKQGEKGINGKNREIPFADKVEPKFRIGDIIKATEDGEVFTVRTITKDKYIYTDDSFDWIKDQDEYELVEQKPIDEEMKELLHTEYEKGSADAIEEMQNPAWSEEDENMLKMVIKSCEQCGNEYAYYWLKTLKDRVLPQPKQEWSEEDEEMLENIICDINTARQYVYVKSKCDEETNWLKSLKDRYTWKPSDEHMDALKEACDKHWEPDGLDPLYTLYQDLKKLKG